tara:strand:+ start:38 stop:298 length:261 start_codon:yes stop_codon:yes gene_type:complete
MYLRSNKENEEELYKKYTDSAWNYAKNCLEYENKYKNYTNMKKLSYPDHIIANTKSKLIVESKKLEKSYDIYDLYLNRFYVNDFTL